MLSVITDAVYNMFLHVLFDLTFCLYLSACLYLVDGRLAHLF